MRAICLTYILVIAASCGGTSTGADASASGPNQVQGLVNGKAFNAKEALSSHFLHTNGFSFSGDVEFVEITDYADACAAAGRNTAATGSLILDLGVAVNDAQGKATVPTGAGTFTVFSSARPLPASTNVAQVYYGSGCGKSVSYEGISGTITVTAVTPDGSFTGTFDVMISCGGFSSCAGPDAHITGSFSSTACTALNVNTTAACT